MSFRSDRAPTRHDGAPPAAAHGPGAPARGWRVDTLIVLVIAWMLAVHNTAFWRTALAGRSFADAGTWLFVLAVALAIGAVYFLALGLAMNRRSFRPLALVVLVTSASVGYFSERYGVHYDREMLRNILATDVGEASDLLTWRLALWVAIAGAAPALWLWTRPIARPPLLRSAAIRVGWIVGAVLMGLAALYPVFADVASFMRNQRDARHLIAPGNLVAAATANALGHVRRPTGPRTVVAGDATPGPAWAARKRPTLFVIVVGETARAQNFSLGGYARPTNPELAQRGVTYFSDATACGTSTEVSLPCMFSPFGRRAYDADAIRTHESLLHALARAGFAVRWRDNQAGCKGVCDGLPTQSFSDPERTPACPKERLCFDDVLLSGWDEMVAGAAPAGGSGPAAQGVTASAAVAGSMVVVLHQMGSHGPAYFKRAPPEYERFKPICREEDLRHCDAASIVNAYDNTIVYTDAFLGRAIDALKAREATHDTALLYVSDHGESLGEKGLYLHGMPYSIAPQEQLKVPFFVWTSASFRRATGLDAGCLDARRTAPVSHDNLFSSMLGVLDVRTAAYEPALDLFAPCRAASPR